MTKSKAKFGRNTGVFVATLALSGLLALGVLYYGQRSASAAPAIPPGANLTSWFDNGQSGQHLLNIWQGSAPTAGVQVVGTVMTDTNCEPDAEGLSHCHNIIDLGNGRSIEVIDTHIMSRHPCLSPGQRLTLTRLNADWVVAREGQPQQAY